MSVGHVNFEHETKVDKIAQLIGNAPCSASGYSFKNSEGYHPLNCKNEFSGKPKACGLSLSMGHQLQITDSGNRLAVIVSVAGRRLPLQFKQISSCMPIFAISNNREALCCFNHKTAPSGKCGKIISHECERAFRYRLFAAWTQRIWINHQLIFLSHWNCFFAFNLNLKIKYQKFSIKCRPIDYSHFWPL